MSVSVSVGIYQLILYLPQYAQEISSPILVSLLVFVLSYYVSYAFMYVYGMSLDTWNYLLNLDESQDGIGTNLESQVGGSVGE